MLRVFLPKRFSVRQYSKTNALRDVQDINKVPITVPLSEFTAGPSTSKFLNLTPYVAEVTRLESGIQIASQEHFGDYCTIGIAINSGSRYEACHPPGTTHLIEKLAFGANSKQSGRDEIYDILEKHGGLIDCQSVRDTAIYAASCHVSGIDNVFDVISNTVIRPQITEDELSNAITTALYEKMDMEMKPECEPLLTDWLHSTAYRGNTLGFPKFARDPYVSKINRKDIFTYMSLYYRPERMVVAGVGIPHSELKRAVEKYFKWDDATWVKHPELLHSKIPPIDDSVAQYTGGELREERDLSEIAVGTPYPNLAHIGLAFESCSYKDKDYVTMCVIQHLLGGGGSFSAGGPGKGMYTRLYTEVMNLAHWMYNCTAYNHSYADTGLFCIQASAPPENLRDALPLVLFQFLRLLQGAEPEELNRAKIQLKSQLMMNLEVRPVMFEDLARQVMGYGRRRLPSEYMESIDKITSDDIIRCAQRILSVKPTLVGYGDLKELASFSKLEDAVAHRDARRLYEKKFFSWQK